MKLIVGLGNPGWVYRNTRHNIGSSVVKALAQSPRRALKKEKGILAQSTKVLFDNEAVVVAIPFTCMNVSGAPVSALLKKYAVAPHELLVVCDDLDLAFARLKLRPQGSSGGHRGLQSIIEALRTDDFCRLRIGIGRPHGAAQPARFVLQSFRKAEKKKLIDLVAKACACCESWVTSGSEETMHRFNRMKTQFTELP